MADLINLIASWMRSIFLRWGLGENAIHLLLQSAGVIVLTISSVSIVIFLIWLERKLAGRIQDRFGPNRAGPYGLFQSLADIIKIFTKEYITPKGANTWVFNLAPILGLASVLLMWAVFPLASTVLGADIHVGVLYIVAVGSFGLLSIIMAGWASNNRYALLGAFRAVAMLVAYEIPMVIALLIPSLLARSMSLKVIVESQNPWYIIVAPVAALIFFISSMAEIGKAPFDLLEAESELVAGYHTEYSGMRFGLFYVTEFLHQFTLGGFIAILFLGGWSGPYAARWPILGLIYFYLKALIVYVIITWVRLTLPRIRIDEMLNFNWKFLIPLSLVNLIFVAVLDKALMILDVERWVYTLLMFLMNGILLWVAVRYFGIRKGPIERERFPERRVAVSPTSESASS